MLACNGEARFLTEEEQEEERAENKAMWKAIEESSQWRKDMVPGVRHVIQSIKTGKLFAGFMKGKGGKAKWTSNPDRACQFLLPYDLTIAYLQRKHKEEVLWIVLEELFRNTAGGEDEYNIIRRKQHNEG